MCRAIKNTKTGIPLKRIFILSVLLVILYAASDEFHQLFTPGRFASSLDLLSDGIGAVIGVWIAI